MESGVRGKPDERTKTPLVDLRVNNRKFLELGGQKCTWEQILQVAQSASATLKIKSGVKLQRELIAECSDNGRMNLNVLPVVFQIA